MRLRIIRRGMDKSDGSCIWENEKKELVEVTAVCKDEAGTDYYWNDKVPKGKVVRCVRGHLTRDYTALK